MCEDGSRGGVGKDLGSKVDFHFLAPGRIDMVLRPLPYCPGGVVLFKLPESLLKKTITCVNFVGTNNVIY